MLHFFRKIRRDLLANSQFFKYLKYAIGEIVLVVLGILIALQINNWNEERKARDQTKILLEEVALELAKNIIKSEVVIDYRLENDSLFFKMLNKKLTYEDYKSDFFLHVNFPLDHRQVNPIDDNFQKLIRGYSSFSPQLDTIVSRLKDIYGNEKNFVDNYDEDMTDQALELRDKLKREIPSFSDFRNSKTSDELIEYCLNDEYYRNEVADIYFVGTRNHLYWVNIFRLKSLKAYEDICDALSLAKDSSITRNLEDYQQYRGTYELIRPNSDVEKVEISGEDQMKLRYFKNDHLEIELIVHPYSDSYHIIRNQDFSLVGMHQIHFDADKKVVGITLTTKSLDEIDGKRPMFRRVD
ncbi:DUF6090 family protein [Lutimonas zeaxanthinifaciens]|uniref:DUF6090 family protein n=1 Tax=Lutimonas zeaxanthinifaciens TaxID=3060215 RepID=UPI00265D32CC|nr:DUF6090 family protein [Lutimonas sp. YSD2104]WKK66516.1 DUF6090 family protein [Lutimonas sp. YSD2104]